MCLRGTPRELGCQRGDHVRHGSGRGRAVVGLVGIGLGPGQEALEVRHGRRHGGPDTESVVEVAGQRHRLQVLQRLVGELGIGERIDRQHRRRREQHDAAVGGTVPERGHARSGRRHPACSRRPRWWRSRRAACRRCGARSRRWCRRAESRTGSWPARGSGPGPRAAHRPRRGRPERRIFSRIRGVSSSRLSPGWMVKGRLPACRASTMRLAVLEHGALVDRALVGDLALVDGGRLVHQVQRGRCGWRCRSRRRPARSTTSGSAPAPAALSSTCLQRRVGRQAGELAHRRRREDQRADFLEVEAGDHRVLHVGRAGGDDLGAQRPHADEGAGGELEVFGDAAVERAGPGGCRSRRSTAPRRRCRKSLPRRRHSAVASALRQ